jgi:alpha-methylacyl-CoA racemase
MRSRCGVSSVAAKQPEGTGAALRLIDTADVLIEGLRPGVVERLGIGPDVCLERNQRLIYGRMTGWGQDGPLASTAGHDIDYIAVSGALHPVGDADRPPTPPLNLFGDFGGGSLYLAMGVLAAVHERNVSGRGQVVDVAMVDGAASLTTMFHELRAAGVWDDRRGSNLLDGGAPWYRTYRAADDRFVAVGAIEPRFFAALLDGLGLDPATLPDQYDRSGWPELGERLAEIFASRTRAEWSEVFEGTDACVAPVMSLAEAPDHPHMAARGTFIEMAGGRFPGPAPRFGRSGHGAIGPPPSVGAHTTQALTEVGYTSGEIDRLRAGGIVR